MEGTSLRRRPQIHRKRRLLGNLSPRCLMEYRPLDLSLGIDK